MVLEVGTVAAVERHRSALGHRLGIPRVRRRSAVFAVENRDAHRVGRGQTAQVGDGQRKLERRVRRHRGRVEGGSGGACGAESRGRPGGLRPRVGQRGVFRVGAGGGVERHGDALGHPLVGPGVGRRSVVDSRGDRDVHRVGQRVHQTVVHDQGKGKRRVPGELHGRVEGGVLRGGGTESHSRPRGLAPGVAQRLSRTVGGKGAASGQGHLLAFVRRLVGSGVRRGKPVGLGGSPRGERAPVPIVGDPPPPPPATGTQIADPDGVLGVVQKVAESMRVGAVRGARVSLVVVSRTTLRTRPAEPAYPDEFSVGAGVPFNRQRVVRARRDAYIRRGAAVVVRMYPDLAQGTDARSVGPPHLEHVAGRLAEPGERVVRGVEVGRPGTAGPARVGVSAARRGAGAHLVAGGARGRSPGKYGRGGRDLRNVNGGRGIRNPQEDQQLGGGAGGRARGGTYRPHLNENPAGGGKRKPGERVRRGVEVGRPGTAGTARVGVSAARRGAGARLVAGGAGHGSPGDRGGRVRDGGEGESGRGQRSHRRGGNRNLGQGTRSVIVRPSHLQEVVGTAKQRGDRVVLGRRVGTRPLRGEPALGVPTSSPEVASSFRVDAGAVAGGQTDPDLIVGRSVGVAPGKPRGPVPGRGAALGGRKVLRRSARARVRRHGVVVDGRYDGARHGGSDLGLPPSAAAHGEAAVGKPDLAHSPEVDPPAAVVAVGIAQPVRNAVQRYASIDQTKLRAVPRRQIPVQDRERARQSLPARRNNRNVRNELGDGRSRRQHAGERERREHEPPHGESEPSRFDDRGCRIVHMASPFGTLHHFI